MSSIRQRLPLFFGIVISMAFIGLASLLTPQDAHAATSTYKRVNNQTIKFFYTQDTPNENVPTSTYYFVAAKPQGLTGGTYAGDNPEDDFFWRAKTTSGNPQVCEDWIKIDLGSTSFTRSTTDRTLGACAAEPRFTSDMTIDNSGRDIFFFKGSDGIIRPAAATASNSEFTQVMSTGGLNLSSGESIYVQTKPAVTCPRLLVSYRPGSWGLVSPHRTDTIKDDAGSKYYRQVIQNFGGDYANMGGCDAGDEHEVRKSGEKALADILKGKESLWSGNNISFHDIKGVVKQLGNAVGDESAAEIKLGTAPAGSVDTSVDVDGSTDAAGSSCTLPGGLGWVLCPIITTLSSLADSMFDFLANRFLEIKVSIFDTNNGTYAAWSAMRNIANILFVVFFLIIIFSQISSIGISNYGIKKMLPRLIVAAVLVNTSYLITQLAIDLSNIAGWGLQSLLVSLTPGTAGQGGFFGGGGVTATNVFGGILAGGLIAGAAFLGWMYIGAFVPILLAGLVAIVIVFIMLILREVLVVLLVVVAPIAFVAFLLPNTKSLFDQWRKIFTTLLLVFPIVGLIFGASSLASNIIQTAYQSTTNADGSQSMDIMLGQIIGAAVLVLPLFLVPVFLKKSLDGIGGIGARLNGIGGKLGGAFGKAGANRFENSALNRGRSIRRQAKQKFRDQEYARKVAEGGATGRLSRGLNFTKAQRAANEQLGRVASSAADKAVEEDIAAASIGIQSLTGDAISDMANGGHYVEQQDGTKKWTQASRQFSDAERTAAIRHTMKTGSFDEKRTVLENIHTAGSEKSRQSARDGYYASGLNNYFGSGLGDSILTGNGGTAIDTTAAMQKNFGSITPQTIAGSNKASMQYLKRAYQGATAEKRAIIEAAFNNIEQTPELRAQVAGEAKQEYDSILAMMTAPSGQATPTPTGDPTVLNVRDNQPPTGPTAPPTAGSPQ